MNLLQKPDIVKSLIKGLFNENTGQTQLNKERVKKAFTLNITVSVLL